MDQPHVMGPHRPRTWVVVAITLGAVVGAVVLFVAGLVTGIALSDRADGSTGAAPSGPVGSVPPTDPAPGAAAVDDCLVGTWRTTEHTESADTEQGRLTITGVERTLAITADGTETVTYGSTPATATTDRGRATVTFAGTVVYGVSTEGDRMSFRLRSSEGTISVVADGGEPTEEELKPGAGPVTYTCEGDRFTQEATGYRSVMERVS